MTVMIQELTTNHRAACQKLLDDCQTDFPQTLLLEDFVSIGGRMIGAVDEDLLKALLIWLPSFDSAYLALLAVDPKARRQGLGKQLMQFWMALMQTNHVRSVGLDVPSNQLVATHLYEQFGFVEQECLANHYSFGDSLWVDAVKMQKIF